jgi:hypothetical protein
MRERSARFLKNFFCTLGRCFVENVFDVTDLADQGAGGVLATAVSAILMVATIAIFCAGIICVTYGFARIAYELMFDPNATDVAARLAAISITPEKWM